MAVVPCLGWGAAKLGAGHGLGTGGAGKGRGGTEPMGLHGLGGETLSLGGFVPHMPLTGTPETGAPFSMEGAGSGGSVTHGAAPCHPLAPTWRVLLHKAGPS